MSFLHKSGVPIHSHIRELSLLAADETLSCQGGQASMLRLAERINTLESMIMELVDDEVLYTMPDMHGDLISAHWNLLTGHYKTAASCLRNGLEVGAVGIYFLLQSDFGGDEFSKWDVGETKTPNWGVTKPILKAASAKFDSENQCELVEDVYSIFKSLCSYTHSKPFEVVGGNASNTMSLVGGNFPGFEKDVFRRLTSMAADVIEKLGILWLACYPDVMKYRKGQGDNPSDFAHVFETQLGHSAIEYAFRNANPV